MCAGKCNPIISASGRSFLHHVAASSLDSLAAMVGQAVEPYAGTFSTNQPHTVAYAQCMADSFGSKAAKEEAEGKHDKATKWLQTRDMFCSILSSA